MKKIILYSVILTVFVYLFGSFVNWDLDPKNWNAADRIISALAEFAIVGFAILFIIDYGAKVKDDTE